MELLEASTGFGVVLELAEEVSESRARSRVSARSICYSGIVPECVIRVLRMQYLSSYVAPAATAITV